MFMLLCSLAAAENLRTDAHKMEVAADGSMEVQLPSGPRQRCPAMSVSHGNGNCLSSVADGSSCIASCDPGYSPRLQPTESGTFTCSAGTFRPQSSFSCVDDYIEITSGTCTSAGAVPISSEAHCEAAATAVGKDDTDGDSSLNAEASSIYPPWVLVRAGQAMQIQHQRRLARGPRDGLLGDLLRSP